MSLHRRTLLAALGVGAGGLAAQARAQSQPAPPATPPPPATQRITDAALKSRHRLGFDGATFSGPAWDMLVREGAEAGAFLIGEEHGIAENPKLAAQLFRALRPAGYDKVCVEISPPMAAELDLAARGGVDGVRAMFADPTRNVPFFGMREEAEWIAAARAAIPGKAQGIWGLDYEVFADRRLIARLKAKPKPAAAARALAALEGASNAAWAQHAATHNPQFIFAFSGDPALVRAVSAAWPRPDQEARVMLETLEETLTINQLFVANRNLESNQRRNNFNKRNLVRFWRPDTGGRVMFKFGANHMVRGLSNTWTFDLGSMVPELLALEGKRSFHLLVLQGAQAPTAQFDPTIMSYRPSAEGSEYAASLAPLYAAAFEREFTLLDLRPIRPLVTGNRAKQLDVDLVRTIHGFDAMLVLSGSTASSVL